MITAAVQSSRVSETEAPAPFARAVVKSEAEVRTSSVERMNTVAALTAATPNLNRNRRRVMAKALYGKAPLTEEERAEAADPQVGRRYSVCGCMRFAAFGKSKITAVQKASGRVHLKGINRCGSVWTCAECAQIIEAHRGVEVKELIRLAREAGYHVLMLTYTFSHTSEDSCKSSMDGLADALRRCRQRRQYRNVQQDIGFVGLVRATEITHGRNGWHTHVHELWICKFPESEDHPMMSTSHIKSRLFPEWRAAAVAVFGEARAPSYKHGLDVRVVWSDTDYTNKLPDEAAAKKESGKERWGGDAEMTKTTCKRGKGSETIWEMMDRASLYRQGGMDKQAIAIESDLEDYARGTYRKRRMYWTPTRGDKPGLRDLFGLRAEQTDEEIVNDAGDHVEGGEPDRVEVDIDIDALPVIASRLGLTDVGYLERFQDRIEGRDILEVLRDDGWSLFPQQARDDGVPRWYAGCGPRLAFSRH